MSYMLAISIIPSVQSEWAATRSLEVIRNLSPKPDRIIVLDYMHMLDRSLSGPELNRHGVRTPKDAPRAQLHELADEVWAENMNEKPDGSREPDFPQFWPRSFSLDRARSMKLDYLMFMRFGDVFDPTLPASYLARAKPNVSIVYADVVACDWHSIAEEPMRHIHKNRMFITASDAWRIDTGFMLRTGISVDFLRDEGTRRTFDERVLLLTEVMSSGVMIFLNSPVYYAVANSSPYPFGLTDPIVDQNSAAGVAYNEELRRPIIQKLQEESREVFEIMKAEPHG